MSRKTNQEICDDFRNLLTEGAKKAGAEIGAEEDFLEITKSWRTDLWKSFKELESRLCPRPEND